MNLIRPLSAAGILVIISMILMYGMSQTADMLAIALSVGLLFLVAGGFLTWKQAI